MKKVMQWTIGLHLCFFSGFIPSLIQGLSFKEFDAIQAQLQSFGEWVERVDKIMRLFTPWI